MDGSNKDVDLDNVNAGDDENKVDLGGVYNGGGDSNDNVEVDDVGRVNANGGDDADFSNRDRKFDCGDHRSAGVGDDGDADSNIGNDADCGDGRSKVDCSKDVAADSK